MTDARSRGAAGQPRDATPFGKEQRPVRRRGKEDSTTRAVLLDAVQELLAEQGHSAITSRKIGERAGVTHQTVFYYFKSLDDLFLALIARNGADFRDRLDRALRAENPLRALWKIARDRQSGVIELQLKAMAVHNPAIRQAMADNHEAFRLKATAVLTEAIGDLWPDKPHMPAAIALMIESIGRYMVLDESITIAACHAQTVEAVECMIEDILRRPPALGVLPTAAT